MGAESVINIVTSERKAINLTERAPRTVEVPEPRTQSSHFQAGLFNATITEVKTYESKTGSLWVTFKLETGDFKRPIFSDVTIAGKGATLVDILHFRLEGIKLSDKVDNVTDVAMALWLESLVGTTVECWVKEETNNGRSILRSFFGGFKATQLS